MQKWRMPRVMPNFDLVRESGAHPEFFFWGGGGESDPEAIYNLCLMLKNYFIKIMF
jgi:hypothetical protein